MRLLAPALIALLTLAPARAPEIKKVNLAHGAWTLNGEAPETRPTVVEVGLRPPGHQIDPKEVPPAPHVILPFDGVNVRWGHVFHVREAGMMRMELEWRPGPKGALFEIILNGQRMRPARDGWRPTDRHVRTDLGAMWLGAGSHLLEFVSREKVPSAELRLSALRLERRGGD